MKQLTATITTAIIVGLLIIWAIANAMGNTNEMSAAQGEGRASILMTLIVSSLVPFALAMYLAFRAFRND